MGSSPTSAGRNFGLLNAYDAAAAVLAAFAQDRKARQRKAELARLQQRHAVGTPREREVLQLIVGGLLNKQAASILEI